MDRRVARPSQTVHPVPLARGTKRNVNEIHSSFYSAGATVVRRSLASPPPAFRGPGFGIPRPTFVRSIGSPPPDVGASGRARSVPAKPLTPVITRSPVAELFHPRRPFLPPSPAKAERDSNALIPRPRRMPTPSRHQDSGGSADGAEWAQPFLARSDSGSAEHQERVQTVRAIDAASVWMDTDCVLVARWRAHWQQAGICDIHTLRFIRKQSMLGYTAAYINRARCAITRLHEWAAVCRDEISEGRVYPVTFEILFLFLSDSFEASAKAHARRNSTKSGAKPFKGTVAIALTRDLLVASKLFRLGIPPEILKDDRIHTHFAVGRSLETQAEQAVLGFRSWVGLELMAAALSKDRRPAKYDKLQYPSTREPAPELEGWGHDDRWDCDAAQTVVVGILASLRTKELLRSHVVAVRIRADGSVVVTGFCAGGKAGRRVDSKPFMWFVDSHMGVTGTTHMWLESWAVWKKKGVWAVASASPVQPSADTRDDQRMLACPVAVISSR